MIAVKNSNEVVENISVWTEGNTISITSEEGFSGEVALQLKSEGGREDSPGRWTGNISEIGVSVAWTSTITEKYSSLELYFG